LVSQFVTVPVPILQSQQKNDIKSRRLPFKEKKLIFQNVTHLISVEDGRLLLTAGSAAAGLATDSRDSAARIPALDVATAAVLTATNQCCQNRLKPPTNSVPSNVGNVVTFFCTKPYFSQDLVKVA
jgi:hypothetical protein